jgi:hypothetical protein
MAMEAIIGVAMVEEMEEDGERDLMIGLDMTTGLDMRIGLGTTTIHTRAVMGETSRPTNLAMEAVIPTEMIDDMMTGMNTITTTTASEMLRTQSNTVLPRRSRRTLITMARASLPRRKI